MLSIFGSLRSLMDDDALKASVFQRLHPRIYLERFLAENVRPDGREANTFREISVNVGECKTQTEPSANLKPQAHAGSVGTANGSALVRLGSTTIVCGVKAEIAEPDLDRPNEGFLGISSLVYIHECLGLKPRVKCLT